MFRLLIAFTFLILAQMGVGQVEIQNQVIATSGNEYANASISMEYTLGEVFTETLDGASEQCTQGFHQPVKSDPASILEESLISITCFPNPFSEYIELLNLGNDKYVISIYDVSGKLVFEEAIINTAPSIRTTFLAPGNYHLLLSSESGHRSHFSIIKSTQHGE
jgi:hypothetical protein